MRKRASGFLRSPRSTGEANSKGFAVEGRPIEKGQLPRLGAPDRPEQGRDKFDVLSLRQRDQVLDDGARLLRVVGGVLVTIAAQPSPASAKVSLRFGIGGVERFACDIAVSGRVHFRIEVAQPHIDAKGRQTPSERAVAWEERNDKEDAQTWRHVEAALKEMRGPSVS
jgi:hypothetical protein